MNLRFNKDGLKKFQAQNITSLYNLISHFLYLKFK